MKRIYNIIAPMVLVFAITSCNLDVVPPGEISSGSFWKTDKDAWYALNTCYLNMPAFDIWDEMCTDNAHSHKPWEGNMELVQQNGISTAAPYGNYDYTAVRNANDFIANVGACAMDESIKNRMIAEARFFRAFAYLELTNYFGKVALVTEPIPYNAPNVARNSAEDVHSFILNELQVAADALPASYAGGYLNETGRVTKFAALALRARAALYFGNFAEAEKSAKEVMDSKRYSLFHITTLNAAQQKEADEMELYIDFAKLGIDKDKFVKGMFSYESLWQSPNATPANPEYVLTHEYTASATGYDESRYTYMIPMQLSIQNGYSSFEPMQDLIDAFWEIDGKSVPDKISVETRKTYYETIWNHTKNMSTEEFNAFASSTELMNYAYMQEFRNRDSRLYASYLFPFKGWHNSPKGDFYLRWDPDLVNKNGNESWTGFVYRKMVSIDPYDKYGSPDDYPTIRYAEVLLTFAEAHLMNSGYDALCRAALNEIRDRCGMPNVPESLSKDEAVDFIRNERRIELSGEGQRFNDVRRYGSAYCEKHLNGASTAPSGSVVVNKVWNDRLLLMPIPADAIDLNPLLKDDQNPEY